MDFKKMIKERGLKITWLADNIGISQPLLSMYLSGKVKMPEIVKEKLIELLKKKENNDKLRQTIKFKISPKFAENS